MVTTLEQIHQAFEERLLRFVNSKQWQWKAVALIATLSIVSIFTNVVPLKHYVDYFDALKNHREYFAYQTILDRANDLTGDHTYPPMTGLNNRTFRLTTPILVKIFHLRPATFWLYVIQLVLGLVFFKLLLNFFQNIFNDKLASLYACVAIATTYVGMSFWVDFSGYADFYSYFFLFLAIYFRSPYLILLSTQLAFWNDERAFVSASLVFIWWWFVPQWQSESTFSIKPNKQMLAIIGSWVLYGIIRFYYLEKMLGMQHTYDNNEFADNLPQNLSVFGFKIGWGFEGLWLFILTALLLLWKQKDFLRFCLILLTLLTVMVLSLTIYDTTRSTAFGYIIIFPCLVVLQKNMSITWLRGLLLIVAILCFLHPLATKTSAIGFFLM